MNGTLQIPIEQCRYTQQIAPLFEKLGNLHFVLAPKTKKAQNYFDQGLKLLIALTCRSSSLIYGGLPDLTQGCNVLLGDRHMP